MVSSLRITITILHQSWNRRFCLGQEDRQCLKYAQGILGLHVLVMSHLFYCDSVHNVTIVPNDRVQLYDLSADSARSD